MVCLLSVFYLLYCCRVPAIYTVARACALEMTKEHLLSARLLNNLLTHTLLKIASQKLNETVYKIFIKESGTVFTLIFNYVCLMRIKGTLSVVKWILLYRIYINILKCCNKNIAHLFCLVPPYVAGFLFKINFDCISFFPFE